MNQFVPTVPPVNAERLEDLQQKFEACVAAHEEALAREAAITRERDALTVARRNVDARLTAKLRDIAEVRALELNRAIGEAAEREDFDIQGMTLVGAGEGEDHSLQNILLEIVEHRLPEAQETVLLMHAEALEAGHRRARAATELESGRSLALLGPILQKEGSLHLTAMGQTDAMRDATLRMHQDSVLARREFERFRDERNRKLKGN